MYKIGIDVGSTFTKYCVMQNDQIVSLFVEKTPIKQKEYFDKKIDELKHKYINPIIKSCGYGKNNIDSIESINELTALAKGSNYVSAELTTVLDIGGQDTKIIVQENGNLKDFFLNDRCAAGSGMFLQNTCNLLDIDFHSIDLTNSDEHIIKLSSVCAVFAQSEITQLLASNVSPEAIIKAVIYQTLSKAKTLVEKTNAETILLSGGFSQIKGIEKYCDDIFNRKVVINKYGSYLSAIGCCL